MNNTRKFIIALALSAFAGIASAVPITGSIGFGGAYEHDGTDLSNATTITILDAAVSGAVTGSFFDEGINSASVVSYSDFVFAPPGAVPGIWSVGSFTFDLTSMVVDFQSANLLALSGKGMF